MTQIHIAPPSYQRLSKVDGWIDSLTFEKIQLFLRKTSFIGADDRLFFPLLKERRYPFPNLRETNTIILMVMVQSKTRFPEQEVLLLLKEKDEG